MPTKPPTWEETVADSPPKWEETTPESEEISAQPPVPPIPELRPAGLREQIGLSPLGTGLGIGRGTERELGRQFGGANLMPQDIMDTAFQFASVPPQLRKPIEKVTDVPINLLPPTVAGGVQGLRDVALGTPWAAGVVGLGKQLGTGLLALFAGDFIAQAPEAYREYKALRAQGRNQEAARLLVSELGTGALLTAGAKIHQDIRAGGKVDPARQALANDILELDAAVPGTLDAAKGMIQRQAPEAQRQAPATPIAPVALPRREEPVPAPEPVPPPTAAAQAVAAAGQAPAAAAAPIPEARTLPAQAAAQMSERARAALASASPEYRRALRAEGLTDADMGDLLSGEASVSDVVARRLKPFEGGGGPDHAKALQEAREDAIARIEALGAKFKTPAAPAAEPTKAQFGDPLNPSNKFTAQPAKLEPDGGIFYAREHRMGELENRPGQSGFLVVDRDAVDEMAFEHDTYQFTPEDVKKTGMKFVSIPELDAAKGDFYDAIQNQKKGAPDATKERQVQESVLGERERTEAQRLPAEAGVSDSLQPAAPVTQPTAETVSHPGPREPVLTRDWNLFQENLNDDLDSFSAARTTGKVDYDLQDVAGRFVDFAKADKSGKPLDKLVSEFAKNDDASQSQIRKLRASVKNVLASEAKPPPKKSLPVEPKGKEPWEMTWKEYLETNFKPVVVADNPNIPRGLLEAGAKIEADNQRNILRTMHRHEVQDAVAKRKTVPKEVLSDYPDIKPTGRQPSPITGAAPQEPSGVSTREPTAQPPSKTAVGKGEVPAFKTEEEFRNEIRGKPYLAASVFTRGKAIVQSAKEAASRLIERAKTGKPFTPEEIHAIADDLGFTIGTEKAYLMGRSAGEAGAGKASLRSRMMQKGKVKPEYIGTIIHEMGHELLHQKSGMKPWELQKGQPLVRGEWVEVQKMSSRDRLPWSSKRKYYTQQTERYARLFDLYMTRNAELKARAPALYAKMESLIADSAPSIVRMREVYQPHYKTGESTESLAYKYEKKVAAEQPTPPPAAETGEKGLGEGPGALTAGTSPTGKSQIEQLADAFRNKAPAKERAWQLVRQSFDFGQRAAAAKDAFSRVLSGINTARKAAQTALTSFEKPDDLLKAKGELSASVETRGWQARAFSKAVKQDTPDIRKRIAMSKWIEADGDPAKLAVGEAATKPEFKQGYRDAQKLTPDEQIKAQNISNYFESRLQEAIDAGVLETGVEDYIHRIYPKDTAFRQRALAYVQSGILSKNPSLAKKRLFEWDWQAEAAGLSPVQDMLPRIIDYETSLSKAIAARQFIAKLTQMRGPDGRPVIGIKGVGVPVTDPSGVRTATVIKPLGDFKKANNPADPLNYRGDYVNKEYGSLSRWKWVGTDTDGKPIFLQGDVAIHPAFVGRVSALLEPSHVRYGRYPRLGTGLLTVGSTVKQTMLDLSGFHQVQIAVHGLEHRVNPFRLVQDIDFADPKMQGLLKGGLTLGGEFHESHMGEGLVGRSLTQHVPVLGPLLETYHNWLFQDFIPRVKTTMALHALERNRVRYSKDLASGRMTEADLNYLTAKQANAAFGELNYITMERSKTTQDAARIIMLAPDFLEARAKFVGQAFTKYGTEQRVALLLGAVAMYSTARILNKIIDDQYHLEPENLFNVVRGNTRYSLRTVQGDVLHAITRPLSFWLNRLNPVYSRTLIEAIFQRDQFGRKRDLWQVLGDTISTVRPIALRSSREQAMWQSILNAFGVTARRYDDVQEARKLATDWKKKNKVREAPGEFIYDSDKDPLRPLKLALSDNDDGGAVAEIRKILQGKVMTLPKMDDYFRRYAKANFTGSAFNERKWMQSLSADDRKTVQAAQQHRQAMLRLYYQARQQYFTALNAMK